MDFRGAYSPDNLRFLMEGFGTTLLTALIAIVLSFAIGCIVGVLRYAKIPVLAQVLFFLVETIRNLPLLLIILFTRFALPQIGINLGILWSAIVGLTVFEAALISEIVRGGLNSVGKGQTEAARSSGLTYAQTLWHILLPQALRKMVPPIVSQFISLLKDTSLAVAISLPELLHHAKLVTAPDPNFTNPILLAVAVLYFAVNYLLSLGAKRLELKQARS